MNLKEESLQNLRVLLCTLPPLPAFDDKRKELKEEIEKWESAERWRLANEKALSFLN